MLKFENAGQSKHDVGLNIMVPSKYEVYLKF
jgi:hypothetical protein